MMKIKYYIFLFILLVLPINIHAYELNCDKSAINYDENFFCYLTGLKDQMYTELSGNITSTNNLVTCTPTSFSNGLSIMESSKQFSYTGQPTDEKLISFSCKLTEQLSKVEKTQIKVENFKYVLANNGISSDNEILSTDFISANIYTDQEEVDDLPRNTSNPNSLLKTLYEDNLNIVFSRFITIYNQEVLYEVDKLNLNVVANNNAATIRIIGNGIENNTNLNVGKNVINIFVTAPDGITTTCYTLNVTRLARGESIYYPEKDATLYSLIVPGYAISFDKDTYEYRIHLASDISKLTVNAVPTYDEATVDISSTTNLKNNSIIKITVTSKDKSTTQDYIIKITKDAPKVNYIPYIVMGVIGLLFIFMIVLFIKTSKAKKSSVPTVIPDIDLDGSKTDMLNNRVNDNNQITSMNEFNSQNLVSPESPTNNDSITGISQVNQNNIVGNDNNNTNNDNHLNNVVNNEPNMVDTNIQNQNNQ